MICEEKIINFYNLILRDNYEEEWQDEYFQIVRKIELHTTGANWFVLETKNYYITIGIDGVKKHKKPYEFDNNRYDLLDYHSNDYESVVFFGQRICCVEERKNEFEVYFDDFSVKVYRYTRDNAQTIAGLGYYIGEQKAGAGNHLLKKCVECGGKGELYLDWVGDFFVRCSSCHSSTNSFMWVKGSIDAWNSGEELFFLKTAIEELFDRLNKYEIKKISLAGRCFERIDENNYYANELIIEFDNNEYSYFLLKAVRFIDELTFSCDEMCDYNKELYPHIIESKKGNIKFLAYYEELDGTKVMEFNVDNRVLRIETLGEELGITFD